MNALLSPLGPDAAFAATPTGPDIHDTRLLSEPAISADRIAFIYAGDLWTADRDGRNVRRLTSDVGAESSPAFSPDGKTIAFSAQYEGNVDVYVVSAEGGVPRRLTWHPGADIVQGFTADGSAVLFTSPRAVHTLRYRQLFTVPVAGGVDTPLEIPNADRAAYSPDGRRIAYNPIGPAYKQWKRYRGGQVSRVWIYDVASHAIEKVPQPPGRANDAAPMWIGDTVYFLSDRDGEFNLYSWDAKAKAVARLTNHTDFPVLNASAGGGADRLRAGGLDPRLRPESGVERPRADRSRGGPAGDAAAVRQGGEIHPLRVSFAVRRADRRRVPRRDPLGAGGEGRRPKPDEHDGAHERSPIWSPDGRRVAYFSDETGEYELRVRSQDGKGEPARFALPGAGFYDRPVWSPDSKKIAYTDNSWTIWWIDLASGASKKVGSEYLYGPQKTIWPAWSPDSRWIAYTLANRTYIQTLYVYSLDDDKSFDDHRRPERRLRAGVRPQRQVPLLLRLDRTPVR